MKDGSKEHMKPCSVNVCVCEGEREKERENQSIWEEREREQCSILFMYEQDHTPENSMASTAWGDHIPEFHVRYCHR